MLRLYFPFDNVYDVANILDSQFIENDIDDADRLIIDEDNLDDVNIILEENDIESVEEIEFELRVYDEGNWSEDDFVKDTFTYTPAQ